ncbi:MEDS domain-containing protein [Mesobacillus jeotgali]|uniref:MEDS domain-containing protein n=1 Tax=Mesobacillus jeotgali TaxID=129985 RepID=UPI0009A81AD6|nr:MEDS domain-containing protein [Mesobacillus jeotgali]
MHSKIQNLISTVKESGAHIFYDFDDEQKYIDNLIMYITAAIGLGNHVMIIENDRIMPEIQNRIKTLFNEKEQEMIHTINNYDFYCYRGNFHKETILSYLQNMISPFLQNNIPIQTWAHVEWREQEEIFQSLGEYEMEADLIIQASNLITICGYDSNRVPDSLKKILMDCHDYHMTDDNIRIIERKTV